MVQIQDENLLEEVITKVIESNTKQVEDYKNGKDKLFGFFVGQVMKETQGKANPKAVNDLLKKGAKFLSDPKTKLFSNKGWFFGAL